MIRASALLAAWLASLPSLAAQTPWWDREPLRIIDLTTSFSRIDELNPASIAARKAALGYNAEHLEVMGMAGGLDDRHFFFKSGVTTHSNPDFLRAYMPEAHKRGIRVFIYFNVHWYTKAFAEEHPDWRQIRENGKPLDGVYDTGADFCVNTPWRKWCFQVLRDLAAYGIDGVFYDGPVYRPDTCYCHYCREKFRSRFGREMPSKATRRGPAFKDLVDFQAASLADFLHDSRQVLKSINPEIALYMNGGVRGANWATDRLNRVLVGEQDLLGSEGGFIGSDLTRVPLWKPGLTARLLESQAPGKPRVIFSAASHKPWTFSILPGPELRLLYADSIANAANVWFGITTFEFDQPEMEPLAAMNAFLRTNAEYYKGTRSEAKAAVVWSDTTANFYSGAGAQLIDVDTVARTSKVGDLDAEFSGVTEALLRAHTPFDVIDDATLENEPLARYHAIFLPNVACMSEKAAARIREYVRAGGGLFATLETSLYDDTGLRRKDFALADVFGAADAHRMAGPRRWDFMRPASRDSLLDGIGREMIPSPEYYVAVSARGARPVLRYTAPLAGRYDGVPPISDDPALLVNSFGKGKAVYFTGDFGNTIAAYHTPELLDIAANAVNAMAPPAFELAGAPGSVEAVLRSQNNGTRLLLHLVNFTGEMTRPIRRVVPLDHVTVSFADLGPVKKAYTLMGRQAVVAGKNAQGRMEFALPRIAEYEVLVIEKQ
jgi:Hypothetical glycosyl hydrolase 6/Beta-galactosidase trimerisation domain